MKRSKYNAKKTVYDGITFHSAKEARRYAALKLLERARKISDLRRQVRYELIVNGMRVCRYTADFVYREGDAEIVEDAKGYRTPEYIIKRKLMMAVYGIEISEV